MFRIFYRNGGSKSFIDVVSFCLLYDPWIFDSFAVDFFGVIASHRFYFVLMIFKQLNNLNYNEYMQVLTLIFLII